MLQLHFHMYKTSPFYSIGWFLVALIIYGSLLPSPIEATESINDKYQHFSAYFITMSWFTVFLNARKSRLFHAAFLASLTYCMELAQQVIDGRTYDAMDIISGIFGIACALIAYAVYYWLSHYRLRGKATASE